VRWLGIDRAAENRGGCGGDGLLEVDTVRVRRDAEVAYFYSRVLHGSNAGLCKEGEREVTTRRGGRATGVHVHGEMGQLSTA
jgi:hypothetical protein